MEDKCYFSTNIAEILSCCKDGKFDEYGFPNHTCQKFPCDKYLQICKDINKLEKENKKEENNNAGIK